MLSTRISIKNGKIFNLFRQIYAYFRQSRDVIPKKIDHMQTKKTHNFVSFLSNNFLFFLVFTLCFLVKFNF